MLVGERGVVKIVDFGLASDADPTRTTTPAADDLPRRSQAAGSPYYMAPERFGGETYDARSDQFSYCVALYEALYHRHPYDDDPPVPRPSRQATHASGPNATRPSPNLTLSGLKARLAAGHPPIAPSRILVPMVVYRALLRGLQCDPAKRFPTMTALLDELSRDPLRRYGPGAMFSIGGLIVGAALVYSIVPAELPPDPCTLLEQEFDGVWDTERRNRVLDSFASTGAAAGLPAARAVVHALNEYRQRWLELRTDSCVAPLSHAQDAATNNSQMACLDRQRATVRAVVDQLAHADRDVVDGAIDRIALLPEIEDCSESTVRRHFCSGEPELTDDHEVRALLDQAQAREIAGKFEEAEALAREAQKLADARDHRPLAAESRLILGRVLGEDNSHREAADILNKAFSIGETAGCDLIATDALSYRAKLFGLSTDLPVAEGLRDAEISFAKVQRLGNDGARLAEAHNNRGLLYQRTERLSEALTEHTQALELRRLHANGAPSPAVALSLLNIGATLRASERLDDALANLRASLTEHEAVYGPEHPRLWKVHFNLATTELDRGDLNMAIFEGNQAMGLARLSFGSRHRKIAEIHNLRWAAYLDQQDYALARVEAEAADTIYAALLPEGDETRIDTLQSRGHVYIRLGDLAAAEEVRRWAWRLAHAHGIDVQAVAAFELAEVLVAQQRPKEALPLCDRAEEALASMSGPPDEALVTDVATLCAPLRAKSLSR